MQRGAAGETVRESGVAKVYTATSQIGNRRAVRSESRSVTAN